MVRITELLNWIGAVPHAMDAGVLSATSAPMTSAQEWRRFSGRPGPGFSGCRCSIRRTSTKLNQNSFVTILPPGSRSAPVPGPDVHKGIRYLNDRPVAIPAQSSPFRVHPPSQFAKCAGMTFAYVHGEGLHEFDGIKPVEVFDEISACYKVCSHLLS